MPVTDTTNPKDLVGRMKVDLALFPPSALIHGAHAFMDGAEKYGAYNWREKAVSMMVYIAAAQRHLGAFLDGESTAEDSGAHHLGHAIACCAIMLDALEVGNVKDDRPTVGMASAILARINAGIVKRAVDKLDSSWAVAARDASAAMASEPAGAVTPPVFVPPPGSPPPPPSEDEASAVPVNSRNPVPAIDAPNDSAEASREVSPTADNLWFAARLAARKAGGSGGAA